MLLKKICLLLILIHTISFAQKNKNEIENKEKFHFLKGFNIIGGAFSFSRINEDDTSQFGEDSEALEYNTNILIDYGYVIKNNFAIGIEYNYTINRLEEEPKDRFFSRKLQDKRTDIKTITPFVRKYFSINKKFLFDLQGGLGFSKGKIEDFKSNTKSKATSFSIYIKPGITYKLANRFALRASIGNLRYFSSKTSFEADNFRENGSTNKRNEFNFNFGLSNLFIGGIFIL